MTGSIEAVFEASTRGAAVFAAGDLGTLAVSGEDRKSWLNGLLTCDVARVAPGRAAYGLAVVKVGRILADVRVVDAGDRVLLGAPRGRIATLCEHFEKYLVMEDASPADESDSFAWLDAHGPAAAAVLARVAAEVGGVAAELDRLGAGGAVAVVPAGARDAALAAARAMPDVVVGDAAAWDELRVARGFPRFGVDYGDESYPQEASLEKVAVSFSKGCYLGQEVVCRLEMRGHVSKKLVAIDVDGGPLVAGAEVTSEDGKPLGAVSSASARGPLGLATVRHAFSEPGTRVLVGGRPGVVQPAPRA